MSVFISDPYAIVQTAGETYIGDASDQVYSINPNLIQAGDVVTIVDQGGTNAIELTAGLEITESIVTSNEMVLTLSNGAIINVRGADTFTFNVGQNQAGGDTVGTEKTFAEFAQDILGVTLPAEGEDPVEGGSSTVNDDGTADVVGDAPSLSIDDVSVTEGDEGTVTATFTVTLSEAPGAGEEVTVDYATADDTATAGVDYVAATGSLTFAESETTKTIEVTVNGDLVDEEDETFNVVLSNVAGTIGGEAVVIGDATGVGTITDDDETVVIDSYTLAADLASVTEGNPVTFTVTALDTEGNPAAVAEDTTFNYQISGVEVAGGTADPADDLGKVTGEVTVLAGESTATFTLTPTDDGVTEGFEGFKVSLLDDAFATVAESGNVVIRDGAESGQNFQMETGTDNLTGTSGDDTFTGVLQAAAADGTTAQPGDTLNGGDGTDTLTISVAGDMGGATDYELQALTTSNIENFYLSNFDTQEGDGDFNDNDGDNIVDTALMTGLEEVGLSASSATGDTQFTGLQSIVDALMKNGAGDLNLDYNATVVAGTEDAQNLTVSNVSAGTFTANGIETINVTTSLVESELDDIVSNSLVTLNISGDQDFTVTNNSVDFAAADDGTDIDGTVNASAMTGDLSLLTDAAQTLSITGGSGDDTFNMGGELTVNDVIDGGEGTDRVIVTDDLTTEMTNISNVEEVGISVADIDQGTNTLSAKEISSANTFVVNVGTAADDDESAVAVTNLETGDTVSVEAASSDTTELADGVALTGSLESDDTADALTLSLEGIGDLTADASNGTGIAKVTFDDIETLSIASNNSNDGTVTSNQAEALQAQSAETINITGSADLLIHQMITSDSLTTIDANTATGDLTLGSTVAAGGVAADSINASVLTLTLGSGDDTAVIDGVNNEDTIDGGDGEDTVVATGVTGLDATTGALNVTNVENLVIEATGANTIDASTLTNVDSLAFYGAAPGDQTVTNAAAGQVVALGSEADEFDAGDTLEVQLADATGTDDSLTINVDNRGGAATDAAVKTADIETINLAVLDDDTANDATVDMTEATATSINVTGGFAGATLALDTLADETVNVDTTEYNGDVTFTAGTTTAGMTVNAAASTNDSNFVLSAQNDTVTVAETGAVDVDIDGGAGTDTVNLTVNENFVDTGEIDNVENLNLTVRAGDDVTIGAADSEEDGINDATNVTVDGGNALSTLTVGVAVAGLLASTNLESFDASSFSGNIDLVFDDDGLDETTDIKAGSLATDKVTATFDTGGTDKAYELTDVDTFNVTVDSGATGGETYTIDMENMSNLTTFGINSGDNTTLNIDNYDGTAVLHLGTDAGTDMFADASQLVVNSASDSGTADSLNLKLEDTEDTGSIDIDAAGVEDVNIELTDDAESHTLDLAGVTATTDSNVTIDVTGGVANDGLTLSALDSTVNAINAGDFDGNLVMNEKIGSSAVTLTGGDGDDEFYSGNVSDVIDTGAGADTLYIDFAAIGKSIDVDLSADGDMITVGTESEVQTGFESVDLSSFTGTGANITGSSADNTIVGSDQTDAVSAGAGDDTITGGDGNDILTGGAGDDDFVHAGKSADGTDTIEDFTTTEDDLDINSTLVTGTAGQGKGTDGAADDYSTSAIIDVAADTAAADAGTDAIWFVDEALTITSANTVAEIETDALTQLSDGGTDFSENFAAGEGGLILMDNGSDTFIFEFKESGDTAATTDADDDLDLIGVLSNVADAGALVAGDFI